MTPESIFTAGPLRDAARAGWHAARGEVTAAEACALAARGGDRPYPERAPAEKGELTIVTDTREQKPYRFDGAVAKALSAGDYSLLGLEDRVAVERKEKTDAYNSLGRGRGRFERELERLSAHEYAAIVIEAGLADFLRPPGFSRMRPKAAINTLVSWSIRYGVHVYFADSRRLARALTLRILEKFHKHRGGGK